MAAKTTGAEFKRFYNDESYWPQSDEVYHEDELLFVNGVAWEDDVNNIPDEAEVKVADGIVYGLGERSDISFETFFRRWLKMQKARSFLVECDVAVLDAVQAAIKAAGGRVV